MSFSDARWLIGLLALPPLVLLAWWAARRAGRALERLVGRRAEHALLAQRRSGDRWVATGLRLGALALLVVGASGPEWGREVVRRGATGSDVVMVMDVSASMDARDVPPSRLAEARREALAVIDRLGGSRVGVVAFAGDAVRLCPLTLDRATARLIVGSLSSGTISEPGTDIGRALHMALRVLPGGRREEQAIVLWTDGEDLESGARAAIEDVARAGVRVFAVGVGTPTGDVVPILDAEGRATDVKREANGDIVRSRLDEDLLRTLARRSHGAYFSAGRPGGELPRLVSALGTVARAGRGQRLVERPVARFPLFAALAALLLVIERIRERRRRAGENQGAPPLHSERGAAAAALLLLLVLPGDAAAQSAWARGDRAFRAGRYAAAESLYALRLQRGGPAEVRVNRAVASALARDTTGSLTALEDLAGRSGRVGREAGYNLGTLLGERRQFAPALDALRRELELHPDDEDARWNYEVLLRRRERSPGAPPRPQPPQPAPRSGQGQRGQGAKQPSPAAPRPGAASPQPGPSRASQGGAPGMDRAQAERLLGALEEQARIDRQQRQKQVRVVRDKTGKDW